MKQGIPENEMNNMRVQFVDHLSKFTLVQMLETMRGNFPLQDSKNLIDRLNKGKDTYQQWNSFHDVFMYEITGVLDVLKDDIEKLWVYLYQADQGRALTQEEIRQLPCVKLLSNLIYQAFDQDKIGRHLPFIRVHPRFMPISDIIKDIVTKEMTCLTSHTLAGHYLTSTHSLPKNSCTLGYAIDY